MKVDFDVARGLLRNSDFKTLFREQLGWDNFSAHLRVEVDGAEHFLSGVAQKRGFSVYQCSSDADYQIRRKIYAKAAKSTHELMIIYADRATDRQIWQWMRREPGKTIASREQFFHRSQSGDALVQKLEVLAYSIEDEERLSLPDVTADVKAALDKERVTKRFYEVFKTEHAAFMKFIGGIKRDPDLQWYASLMLNRMMFIYFIQKKGFLDGDPDYLRNRMLRMQQEHGNDKFYSFYRYFLLRLFHEGLATAEDDRKRKPDLDRILGKVPYLNGGFFEVHQLETTYREIEIPDKAFEKLFAFFDRYQWHLDERPVAADNEINPDVVGYIFEKYINQKQMGAYYSKEDITEYISKNTVLPYLFDAAKKECAVAFRSDALLWRMLQTNPDHYIYEPARRGVIDGEGEIVPLPPEIEAGIGDVSKRAGWNRPASAPFALPTETWREHVARRKRCLEVRAKLAAGEVHETNDLITLNLNIWQFARDAITNAEGPELLRAFWHALQKLTVLDPACGSGAFLFAALRILETLYSACTQRMRQFLDDLDRSGEKHRPERFKDFRKILGEIELHPNEDYYVLKSIIVGNLFGVDIMEEAVEICKLRLFLKLAAQVRTPDVIEPLPDIDFNIRAGNSLVGFTSLDAVREAMTRQPNGQSRMLYAREQTALNKIEEQGETADRQFQLFRHMQTDKAMRSTEFATAKAELRKRLAALQMELDRYLAREYGIDPEKPIAFEKWRASHQPFHWFVEFNGIMNCGGFDAIIGNPPYVEYVKVKTLYEVSGYSTLPCGNLWAFMLERSISVLDALGRVSLIVPLSLISAERMGTALTLLSTTGSFTSLLPLSGDAHPCVLFDGVKMSFTVLCHAASRLEKPRVSVSKLYRWLAAERDSLFPCAEYIENPGTWTRGLPTKMGSDLGASVFLKLRAKSEKLGQSVVPRSRHRLLYHRIVRHFVKSFTRIPYFWNERDGKKKSEDYKELFFESSEILGLAHALLISSTYYLFFIGLSDSYHCGRELILCFPVDLASIPQRHRNELIKLGLAHQDHLFKNSKRRRIKYRSTGWIEYDEFYPRESKHFIDQIDGIFAEHYGFSKEELDFIINYDIKYRMGRDETEDAE